MHTRNSKLKITKELVAKNHGYITVSEAKEHGVTALDLAGYARRGSMIRVGNQVYRDTDYPYGDYDGYRETLLCLNEGAYIHGESVLHMFDLGEVFPQFIYVRLAKPYRGKIGSSIKISKAREEDEPVMHEGVLIQNVKEAFRECMDIIGYGRVFKRDVERAYNMGLITRKEMKLLLQEAQVRNERQVRL